jgi:hypothetical protein
VQQSEQTEDKRGGNREVTVEIGQTRAQKSAHLLPGEALEDDVSEQIEATTSSTTSTLAVVQSSQEDGVSREDDSLTGHVDTKGECTSGDHNAEEALAEEDLTDLAVLPVHTSVMNTDTASEGADEPRLNVAAAELLDIDLHLGALDLGQVGKVITSLRCIGVEVVPFACVSGTSITLLVQLGAWAIFSILITLGLLAGLGRFSGLGILELNLLPLLPLLKLLSPLGPALDLGFFGIGELLDDRGANLLAHVTVVVEENGWQSVLLVKTA